MFPRVSSPPLLHFPSFISVLLNFFDSRFRKCQFMAGIDLFHFNPPRPFPGPAGVLPHPQKGSDRHGAFPPMFSRFFILLPLFPLSGVVRLATVSTFPEEGHLLSARCGRSCRRLPLSLFVFSTPCGFFLRRPSLPV